MSDLISRAALLAELHNELIDQADVSYRRVKELVMAAPGFEIEKCEPVAYRVTLSNSATRVLEFTKPDKNWEFLGCRAALIEPLYDKPQPREWVGLSDSEWVNIVNHEHAYDSFTKDAAVHHAVKATEAKLKQLNTKG